MVASKAGPGRFVVLVRFPGQVDATLSYQMCLIRCLVASLWFLEESLLAGFNELGSLTILALDQH